MLLKTMDALNVTEIDVEKDTVASAFLKGMTDTYVKTALICGILHLGIKAYEHYKKESTSEDGD